MIILGCDHAGFELKEKIKKYLINKNEYAVVDVGAFEINKDDDFSSYVKLMIKCFKENKASKIIAVCGSGVGMSIGLNKQKGIFCVLGYSEDEVKTAREHNDVNALALGGRVTTFAKAKKMVDVFLNTEHLGGKYKKRMEDIDI